MYFERHSGGWYLILYNLLGDGWFYDSCRGDSVTVTGDNVTGDNVTVIVGYYS